MSGPLRIILIVALVAILFYLVVTLTRGVAGAAVTDPCPRTEPAIACCHEGAARSAAALNSCRRSFLERAVAKVTDQDHLAALDQVKHQGDEVGFR